MEINILAIGDVVGRPGLDIIARRLPALIRQHNIQFTVINGENAAMIGLSPSMAEELFDAGADVITLGNHTFSKKEIIPYLDEMPNIIRPLNLAPDVPGNGHTVVDRTFGSVLVINAIGRCNMDFGPDNPFRTIDALLQEHPHTITLVDFHAEATSEKVAMGKHLDGRVSAVWGTHTHVQTSDACVLPNGTGYITDLGMTGPADGVLGVKAEQSVHMFLGHPRGRYDAAPGATKLECALFTIDATTGKTTKVEALRIHD